jgi:hypothetical protein
VGTLLLTARNGGETVVVDVNYTLESVAEDRFRGNVPPHSIRLRDVISALSFTLNCVTQESLNHIHC